MNKPYCIVEGKKYKLNSVYSFPEIMETPDLNQLWIDYSYNRITLHDVFLIYSSIGCSYDFVFNYFSKSGRYGSCRRKGDFLNFEFPANINPLMTKKSINIGLIGFGCIGTGVAKILLENKKVISLRLGTELKLKKICDKDLKSKRNIRV